ncbi:MAG: hypothetical protein WCH62_02055, partial [Candidatus Omnitrophota bacterium]
TVNKIYYSVEMTAKEIGRRMGEILTLAGKDFKAIDPSGTEFSAEKILTDLFNRLNPKANWGEVNENQKFVFIGFDEGAIPNLNAPLTLDALSSLGGTLAKVMEQPEFLAVNQQALLRNSAFQRVVRDFSRFYGNAIFFSNFLLKKAALMSVIAMAGWTLQARADITNGKPVGGIDLNAANLNLQIRRDGKGVPLPIAQQDLEHINIEGLIPVIMEIKPAAALPIFSELQNAKTTNG